MFAGIVSIMHSTQTCKSVCLTLSLCVSMCHWGSLHDLCLVVPSNPD